MNNRKKDPAVPATVLDELAFARDGSFEIEGAVMRAEERSGCLSNRAWDIGRLMSIFDHGLDIGRDLFNESEYLSEKSPTEDELVRWYFHALCANEDTRAIFRHPGDDPEADDFPYDSGWHWLNGKRRKGKIPVTDEIVWKARRMARDANKLMSDLCRAPKGRCESALTLVATFAIRYSTENLAPSYVDVEASYDYVALNPGRDVFVGAYEVAPVFSVADVRRHAGINHWGARAYLGKLLASAYFGLPVEWRHVVACSKPYEFGYVWANVIYPDEPATSFSEGYQEGPFPCRAYDVGTPSLDEGRIALHRALYRLCFQSTSDALYLRHETI